ncbi:MAG: hypothetical protein ABSC06_05160 [Rhodopila sp.]|jgi:hypothetical protein
MSDHPPSPPVDETPERVVPVPNPPPRHLAPWLYGLGFLVLAGAIYYLWQYPRTAAETADNALAIHTVQQRLVDIDARLTRLEQRPSVDQGKINARLDALDERVRDPTQLASRLDTLSGRIESLAGRDQTGLDTAKQQLDAIANRIASVESSAGSLDAVTKRMNRIAKLQQASFALAAGQPIGDIPGAPEPLARYAHVAPPTLEQLRLRFSRDEQAALGAIQPDDSNAPFIGRVLDKAQGLITIRRGDDVVVGNTAAIILSHAHAALDVDDVAGAVNAVESLTGQPAQAMANWLADAKALLAARAALANMANQI